MGFVFASVDSVVFGDGIAFYVVDSGFYRGIDHPNDRSGVRLLGRNCCGSEPGQGKNSRDRPYSARLSAIYHAKAPRILSIPD
jgi:hypothetical protein